MISTRVFIYILSNVEKRGGKQAVCNFETFLYNRKFNIGTN